ncbi:MAG: hypothetical protein II069_05485 [Oscillospiraceae bacterium]|jgi:hypothetical protein|nr:hypothetical protein [Oscillospiraceae bacterium]
MEKKNNSYVLCAIALFVLAFVLTLTHVFHVNESGMTFAFGYSGMKVSMFGMSQTTGAAVWAKIILIILNLGGAAFLGASSMNVIPKFNGSKYVPVAIAGVCLVVAIIAWIVVGGSDSMEGAKLALSFDGWMLLLTELAACGASFMAGKDKE